MRLSDFDFNLPAAAIAQRPAVPRDAARLLVVDAEELRERTVSDLPRLLRAGDVVVLNDTRVIPARLRGRRDDVEVDVTLIEEVDPGRWRAMARRSRRLRAGQSIVFADDLTATVEVKDAAGMLTLAFDRAGPALSAALDRHGRAPLPPYIKRRDLPDDRDRADYQTVFATVPGAVAAPTAGLHFTEALLRELDGAGLTRVTVTLHVGAGTFLPVKVDSVAEHRMHGERGRVTAAAAAAINAARRAGGRIVAVGTTVLRLLEAAADVEGRLDAFDGETDLFVTPGYRFRTVDVLLTNFHLPRSTLFMLVCAFAGTERMKDAYRHALAAGYRFYSYGDCCLLERRSAP